MVLLLSQGSSASYESEIHSKTYFSSKQSGKNMKIQLKFSDYFRPVYRVADGEWERVEQAIVFVKLMIYRCVD